LVIRPEQDRLTAMLTRLKLTAIRDQLGSLLDEATRDELSLRESLALLCEREIARKDSRRIEIAIGLARFPYARDFAGFDFLAQPSISRGQIRDLASGRIMSGDRVNPSGGDIRNPATPRRKERQDDGSIGMFPPGRDGRRKVMRTPEEVAVRRLGLVVQVQR
jgi:hypothetical protein